MTVFYISDKVGDRAIAIATGSRPDDPAGALQCVRCGALGTQTDSSRWPTIAGQVCHVRHMAQPSPQPDEYGNAGPTPPPRRTLCGGARRIGRDA